MHIVLNSACDNVVYKRAAICWGINVLSISIQSILPQHKAFYRPRSEYEISLRRRNYTYIYACSDRLLSDVLFFKIIPVVSKTSYPNIELFQQGKWY